MVCQRSGPRSNCATVPGRGVTRYAAHTGTGREESWDRILTKQSLTTVQSLWEDTDQKSSLSYWDSQSKVAPHLQDLPPTGMEDLISPIQRTGTRQMQYEV